MRIIYSFVLYLLTPYAVVRLFWRSRRLTAYRFRIRERFAHFQFKLQKPSIWVHAVSVGEVIVAVPLIKRLKQVHPECAIIVTTTTPTGSEQVKTHFKDFSTEDIFHIYAPYDLPHVVKRFLNRVKPRIAIMMETELWPNILYQCHKKHIPVFIANARLSARSAKNYGRLPHLMRSMLANITTVIAQNKNDAKRYINLGLDKNKVIISGSMKFDLQLPASVFETSELLRQQWGIDRPVWICASTHEGEEELILSAFATIKKTIPNILLVLVPRHPDRFEKVTQLVQKKGYQTIQRSDNKPCQATTDVFIGNTMGELTLFYAASDVAFVGGSLVETGGHNLLEPAALGIPIVTGPYMFNFNEINELLKQAGSVVQINHVDQLAPTVINYFNDAKGRTEAGEKGRQVVLKNRGALDKHVEILQQCLFDLPQSR